MWVHWRTLCPVHREIRLCAVHTVKLEQEPGDVCTTDWCFWHPVHSQGFFFSNWQLGPAKLWPGTAPHQVIQVQVLCAGPCFVLPL